MSIVSWIRLQTKKGLLHLYGPPTLDEENDPIVEAEREYARAVREEEAADAQEARATQPEEADEPASPGHQDPADEGAETGVDPR